MKENFIWGVASASYQIEGGACEGGKGPSVWDIFSHTPGRIRNNENGDVACDSYHRFEEDLDIIASMGVKNYRFSISWPRIYPAGNGEVNPEGLAFYDRVVAGCLKRGITPWITLFHWDLPQALEEAYGGWYGEQISDDFASYAVTIARHFEGRVKHYFIMNEPQCFIGLGYSTGDFAPGRKLPAEGYFKCWHNMLLAHGKAVKAMREAVPGLILGVATTGENYYPASDKPEDVEAACRMHFGMERFDYNHVMYLDPILKGTYPDVTGTVFEGLTDNIPAEDMKLIAQKLDFLGFNVYNGTGVICGADGKPEKVKFPAGYPRTAFKWPITPRVMRYLPLFYYERYGLPMIVSENGMSNGDFVYPDGRVHDPQRIEFLRSYLEELEKAADAGLPVMGYFQWSILDNFEWTSGYDERFGLVYVDYATGKRIPKDSALWYADRVAGKVK